MNTQTTETTEKKSLFVMDDGRNLMFTFILVSSLFLLWGLCNGMIDVMDKHFQDELGLTKSQSAWVQFAHYLGYFLMALPAGWLAIRLGYKGGIIAGLLMVAAGGFWFVPATHINDAGPSRHRVHDHRVRRPTWPASVRLPPDLTFLETVANPYTTVLGPPKYAATRINLAQSCNGVGWILGPIDRRRVLLLRGRRGQEHRQRDALYSLRRRGVRRARPLGHLLLRLHPGHQDRRRLSPGRF